MCTQENTSVILPSSSNFRVLKSFHNGPIETTGMLSWNVPDETLDIICKVSSKALRLNLKNFIPVSYYVRFPQGWGQNQVR